MSPDRPNERPSKRLWLLSAAVHLAAAAVFVVGLLVARAFAGDVLHEGPFESGRPVRVELAPAQGPLRLWLTPTAETTVGEGPTVTITAPDGETIERRAERADEPGESTARAAETTSRLPYLAGPFEITASGPHAVLVESLPRAESGAAPPRFNATLRQIVSPDPFRVVMALTAATFLGGMLLVIVAGRVLGRRSRSA